MKVASKTKRRKKRAKEEDLRKWERYAVPQLNQILEDFHEAMFDEYSSKSYNEIFEKYNLLWQRKVRLWNHRIKRVKGDEYAFFKSFFPVENYKAVA